MTASLEFLIFRGALKEKRRLAEQKAIDTRFDDHDRFVSEVMTIEPSPYLKLVAVLHREA